MKTEKEIAKGNVKKWKKSIEDKFVRLYYYACEIHFASCKRFLEFLKKKDIEIDKLEYELTSGFGQNDFDVDLSEKIKDLQKAIKIYEKAGFEDLK